MRDTCNSCGKSYADCSYPLSHGHATIHSVKLPSSVNRIMARRDRRGFLNVQDRTELNSIDVLGYYFPSQFDEVN